MTKNKFIKALKIMCVLAPILWSFATLTIAFIGTSISLSGVTSVQNTDRDNGLSSITVDAYDIGIKATITSPINFILRQMKNSTLGAPIYNLYDWTTTNVFGLSIEGLNALEEVSIILLPIYFTFLIFWYLTIEIVFFIPEVLILFIRWCKNLIYSFTRKGGFDA